jgi:hypothetical protein
MQMLYLAGMPRCGSSWAGRVIAAGHESNLIDEPFNPDIYPDRRHFYMVYIPAGCTEPNVKIVLEEEIRKQTPRWKPWRRPKRFVVKDVHAYTSMARIYELYKCPIVILVRNPLDMAASWARLNWSAGQALFKQPSVVNEFVGPFEKHFMDHTDYYGHFGAYWGLSYYIMERIQQKIPNCQTVRFEDLCTNPNEAFTRLMQSINLPFLPLGHEFLSKHNREPSHGENEYSINRVTANETDKWKTEISLEQAKRVIDGARPFGLLEKHYPELLKI